jgi:hypothetical protein
MAEVTSFESRRVHSQNRPLVVETRADAEDEESYLACLTSGPTPRHTVIAGMMGGCLRVAVINCMTPREDAA